jgi:actin, other eukaryote
MEKVWNHTFYVELGVCPDEHPVLITEGPVHPKVNREKMTQIMFETFNVPALYIAFPSMLSMCSAGRTTGIICDSGDGITHTTPICEGFSVNHAVNKIPIAGRDITQFLARLLLFEKAYECDSSAKKEMMKDIKEKLCYVAQDYEQTLNRSEQRLNRSEYEKKYEMPDG